MPHQQIQEVKRKQRKKNTTFSCNLSLTLIMEVADKTLIAYQGGQLMVSEIVCSAEKRPVLETIKRSCFDKICKRCSALF